MSQQTIGFIGLGQMGRPMAANLLAAGFNLRVYNRTRDKARELEQKGAAVVEDPKDTAAPGGIVVSMVADDRALEAVAGDELAKALGPGGLHVSMSTVLPATSVKITERHAKFGATLLASPVFGRPEAAAARKLWVCTAGPADAKQRSKPIFDAVGQGVFDFGEGVGSANVVKLAGNFLLTAAIEAMAEASALCEKNGIPRDQFLGTMTQTLFNCPIYQNYGRRVIAADFEKVGFPAVLALKDMRLAQQTAAESRAPMPVLDLLVNRYLAAIAKGDDKLDASVLARGAAKDAGLQW